MQAVFESVDEPWFVGARVATCATILRRQHDERSRMGNVTRFVQLRRPIAEVLGHDGTTAGAMAAADCLRDAVLSATASYANADARVRLVPQADLWNRGVALGRLVRNKPTKKPAKADALAGRQGGDYFGGKWGQYVRAPDLWFDLLDRCGEKLVPLAQIAQVRRGITSGNDGFFYPVDDSQQALKRHADPAEFEAEHRASRADVEAGRVRIVKCGEKRGELRPLEFSVLQPVVHNLKDVKHYDVRPGDCAKLILLTGRRTAKLPEHAKSYALWGERNGWHEKATAAARQTDDRDWHDLTGFARGAMLWSMRHGYRHVVPRNGIDLQCNKSLFDVRDLRGEDDVLCGVLNSSLVLLSKLIFGHPIGVEGYLETEVFEAKMMLVPDVRKASSADRGRVAAAMDALKRRKPLNLISPREFNRTKHGAKGEHDKLAALSDRSELDQSDRRELDDAVLRLLGYGNAAERGRLLDVLYGHLRRHFVDVRRKEEKANANKKRAKRKGGRGSASAVAEAVVRHLRERSPHLFRRYPQAFVDADVLTAMATDTYEIPKEGEPELAELLTAGVVLRVAKGRRTLFESEVESREQGELLVALARQGVRGLVPVPHGAAACVAARERFEAWVEEREEVLARLLERETADEDLRDKARAAVLPALMSQRADAQAPA